ncbi:hypothetical protein NDA12_002088 [Ustilago hordei]|nr:hypothetical protein NDA15_000005 [Ustilago hordei]KAJ1581785.1 hypothetical protein NDA12_002088 [Ustilago hordei]
MKVALPLELVDLILQHSLGHRDSSVENNDSRYSRESQALDSPTALSSTTRSNVDGLINLQHAIAISPLSKHHQIRFQPELYRHVTLQNVQAIDLFGRTISARPDLTNQLSSLAIFSDDTVDGRPRQFSSLPMSANRNQATVNVNDATADAILSACPNVTHLLLSCTQFSNLSASFYSLLRPKEVTLINVSKPADLNGIVTRHRDLTAAALQNDPRIQAALGNVTASQTEQSPSSSSPSASEPPGNLVVATASPRIGEREPSLSHLHLVNFDGRLIHHLATVSSLTHLVLTYPLLPETRPGVPGLSIIPRSLLILLLGSGNIVRIIIRAPLSTCIRIMEELAPIEDRNLVFRPIRTVADPLFPADPARHPTTMAALGERASALFDALAASGLDLLAEFYNRVRLHLHKSRSPSRAPSSLDGDPDTSRDSSRRRSHSRSSDSTGSGNGATSSGWGEEEDAERPPQTYEDASDGNSEDDLDESGEEFLLGPQPSSTRLAGVSIDAPPLNIPIEELLRDEGFTHAGLAGQLGGRRSGSSNEASTSTGTGSGSGSGSILTSSSSAASSSHSRRQRQQQDCLRQRVRRDPYSVRPTDLRGATQANIDVCAQIYEALASNAGIEQEMGFW